MPRGSRPVTPGGRSGSQGFFYRVATMLLLLAGLARCSVPPSAAPRPARNSETQHQPSIEVTPKKTARSRKLAPAASADFSPPTAVVARALPRAAAPETHHSQWVELAVPGFRPSLATLPRDEAEHPWLLAAHGAGDTAQWQCRHWRELLGERQGIVVCPAGRQIHRDGNQGEFFPDHRALQQEVRAVVTALASAFGARLAAPSGLYVAYSQGATMGALMLPDEAHTFPRLLLVEGGYAEWNARRAKQFAAGGGLQVAFVCGTGHCAAQAERSARSLQGEGVEARVWAVPTAGHSYGGALSPPTHEALEWLLLSLQAERTVDR